MSDSTTSLIPTAADGVGYGSTPAVGGLKKDRAPSSRTRVVAGVASACALLGVVAMLATGKTAPLSSQGDARITFDDVLAQQGHSYAALQKSRAEGIAMLQKMNTRRVFNVPGQRAHLGASEYEKCVAHGSHASEDYNTTDSDQIRQDLVFDVSREAYPAVTAYNDSKALLMALGCEVPPPATFKSTSLCSDDETKDFCNSNCNMPAPQNCNPGSKDFGGCEPTVRAVCNNIELSRKTCKALKDQITSREEKYDSIEVGALPCRTDPEAPFAKAAYAQMKYESAYLEWVDAVNDATEVCTIGHALWVHNLALYQAHYATIVSTTNDLKAICAEEGGYDGEVPVDEDGNTTNSFIHHHKFDMSEVIADAEEGFFEPAKHHHMGRKLVWWQQLCEPSISAMEALCRSLEIETPQLKCFAETCQVKKAAEEVAFDALVKAHNKFEVVFSKYTDDVHGFNSLIKEKNIMLAQTISAYESFHPVQAEVTIAYDKDVSTFERFDSGADKGHCGLSDCQVNAICSHNLITKFEEYVNVETCTALPYDTSMICNPPPSPPPPPPSPSPPPPRPPPPPATAPVEAPPAPDEAPAPKESGVVQDAGTEAWEEAMFLVEQAKNAVEEAKYKLQAAIQAAKEADALVADLEARLAAAIKAAEGLTGAAKIEALKAIEELRRQLAAAKTAAWEAHEAVDALRIKLQEAEAALEEAQANAEKAKQLVGAINALQTAEKALEEAKARRNEILDKIEEAENIIAAAAALKAKVEDLEARLKAALAADPVDEELVAQLRKELEEAKEAYAEAQIAADAAEKLLVELREQLEQAEKDVADAKAAVEEAKQAIKDIKAGDVKTSTADTLEEAQEAWENAVKAVEEAQAEVDRIKGLIADAEAAIAAADAAQALVDDLKARLAECQDNGDTECVARLEKELAEAEKDLAEKKAAAAEAKAALADLKAQLVEAEEKLAEAKAAEEEAKRVVDEIAANMLADQQEGEDVHGIDALTSEWEAALERQAEAAKRVADIKQAIAEAKALIEAAEDAKRLVEEIEAKIAEQEAICTGAAEKQDIVDDLKAKLEAARSTDPVDDEAVSQLEADLAEAEAINDEAQAACEEAQKVLVELRKDLADAIAAHEAAAAAAAGAIANLEQLEKDLAAAEKELEAANNDVEVAKAALDAAVAYAEAEKAHQDALDAVEDLKRQLEEARNADPVDEELIKRLEEQLAAAEAHALTTQIALDNARDHHENGGVTNMDDQERQWAEEEFKNARREGGQSSYVAITHRLWGYTTVTFNEELKSTFKHVVANIVQTVDKTVTTESITISSVTDVAVELRKRALLSDDEEVIPKIDVAYEIYTDEDLTPVVDLLNSIDLRQFKTELIEAGLVDLIEVTVTTVASEQQADVPGFDLTDEERAAAAEREAAAAEFRAARDAARGAETAPDVEPESEGPKTEAQKAADAAAETVAGVASRVADAEKALADAEARVKEIEEALERAREELASCTDPESCAAAQAKIDALTAQLVAAQTEVEKAKQTLEDTKAWHAAAEELADAAAAVADLKIKIAIAEACANDDSDKEKQAACIAELAALKKQLEEAEQRLEDAQKAVDEAKAEVEDAFGGEESNDQDDELAKATEAWEQAEFELNEAKKFLESIKTQLEECRIENGADSDHCADLEQQLEDALRAVAEAQIKVDLAKELVDKIAAGETAASEAKKLEEAKDAVADAEKAVEDAQAVVDDLKRRLEEALNADPVDQDLVDSLREQLKVAEAELVTAKENLEAAEALVRALESDVDPEHEKHLEFDAHKDEWNEEAHEKAMAEYDAAVDNAKAVMDAAQAKVDEIKAKLEAMQAACDDDSDPIAQKAACAAVTKLERELKDAEEELEQAKRDHADAVRERDEYVTKAMEIKAAHEAAADIAETIRRQQEAREAEAARKAAAAANAPGPSPAYGPGMSPGPAPGPGGAVRYVKIVGGPPDYEVRYVPIHMVVEEAQKVVDDIMAELRRLLALMQDAADAGDAAEYARLKKLVDELKKRLKLAQEALADAIKLAGGEGPSPAPAPGPSGPQHFVNVNGEYLEVREAAERALQLYNEALGLVNSLKQQLLDLIAQMAAAAANGDRALYEKLKAMVEKLKEQLRVAERKLEEARIAYNNAAAQAPGYAPEAAPETTDHYSILDSDIHAAQTEVDRLKAEILRILELMRIAAANHDGVEYKRLLDMLNALKKQLAEAEDKLDRLQGVKNPDYVPQERSPPPPPSPPPLPRYQGPPATISVDAKHIAWFSTPKGAQTGSMSSAVGGHTEVAEIENVLAYDVVPKEGLRLGTGDLKLPPMRSMNDEAVSVAIRLKFFEAPSNGACLYHMGDGEDNLFEIKFMDNALTFSATPSHEGGGIEKKATIAMDTDMSHFELDREYTIVAVMGNDGYMYLFVDGDKVAEGNGMVNELNGFIRDVTMTGRRDNYVGTCYIEDSQPLSAGIITVDVFDGEMNDLDVTMVSGKFTQDEDFTIEPEIEI